MLDIVLTGAVLSSITYGVVILILVAIGRRGTFDAAILAFALAGIGLLVLASRIMWRRRRSNGLPPSHTDDR